MVDGGILCVRNLPIKEGVGACLCRFKLHIREDFVLNHVSELHPTDMGITAAHQCIVPLASASGLRAVIRVVMRDMREVVDYCTVGTGITVKLSA